MQDAADAKGKSLEATYNYQYNASTGSKCESSAAMSYGVCPEKKVKAGSGCKPWCGHAVASFKHAQCVPGEASAVNKICIIHTHTHTHTHIYIVASERDIETIYIYVCVYMYIYDVYVYVYI